MQINEFSFGFVGVLWGLTLDYSVLKKVAKDLNKKSIWIIFRAILNKEGLSDYVSFFFAWIANWEDFYNLEIKQKKSEIIKKKKLLFMLNSKMINRFLSWFWLAYTIHTILFFVICNL